MTYTTRELEEHTARYNWEIAVYSNALHTLTRGATITERMREHELSEAQDLEHLDALLARALPKRLEHARKKATTSTHQSTITTNHPCRKQYLTRLTIERARTQPLTSEELANIYETQERERRIIHYTMTELLEEALRKET